MNDFYIMQRLKTPSGLNKYFPYVIFIYQLVLFLMILYHLKYIPSVRIFHHYTKLQVNLKHKTYQSIPEGSSKKASL